MRSGRLPAQTAASIAHFLSYKPRFLTFVPDTSVQSAGTSTQKRGGAPLRRPASLYFGIASVSCWKGHVRGFGFSWVRSAFPSSTSSDALSENVGEYAHPANMRSRSCWRRTQETRTLRCSLDSPPSSVASLGSDGAFTYRYSSRARQTYSVDSASSASGLFFAADGTFPTSLARRSESSRLECTPSSS